MARKQRTLLQAGLRRILDTIPTEAQASRGILIESRPEWRLNSCLELLEVGVAFYEFFCAPAGKADGEAAVVFIAFHTDDGTDTIFGVADFCAEQRICLGGAFYSAEGVGGSGSAARSMGRQ